MKKYLPVIIRGAMIAISPAILPFIMQDLWMTGGDLPVTLGLFVLAIPGPILMYYLSNLFFRQKQRIDHLIYSLLAWNGIIILFAILFPILYDITMLSTLLTLLGISMSIIYGINVFFIAIIEALKYVLLKIIAYLK